MATVRQAGRRMGRLARTGGRALALAALLFGAEPLDTARADDWPQFMGRNRDGRVPGDVDIARTWPSSGPPVVWSIAVQPGFSGAAVSGDEVFILEREDDARTILRCLSFATGEERWRFTDAAPGRLNYNGSRSVPSVEDGVVYATDPFGKLFCIDRKTHKAVWTQDVLKTYEGQVPRWGYAMSPLRYENLVIVPAMGRRAGIVAFDAKTGAEVWASPPLGGDSYVSPILHRIGGVDQVLWVGGRSRRDAPLIAVDAKTGKPLWEFESFQGRIPIAAPTAIAEGKLFLSSGYGAGSVLIHVEKKGDGFAAREGFRIRDEGAQIHQALLHGDHLYANFNTNENLRGRGAPTGLACIGLDGTMKWNAGNSPPIDRGALLLIGDLLLVMGGEDGVLHLVEPSPEGYRELAKATIFTDLARRGNNIWAPMAFARGKLLVRSQTELKCLDLSPRKQGAF